MWYPALALALEQDVVDKCMRAAARRIGTSAMQQQDIFSVRRSARLHGLTGKGCRIAFGAAVSQFGVDTARATLSLLTRRLTHAS